MAIKIGIRAHDLCEKQTPETLASRLEEHGFSYVQLVFNKALAPYSYEDAFVDKVAASLKEKKDTGSNAGCLFQSGSLGS